MACPCAERPGSAPQSQKVASYSAEWPSRRPSPHTHEDTEALRLRPRDAEDFVECPVQETRLEMSSEKLT